ncbi:related to eIF3l - translation initiation factor 3 subunit L [Pseudozyma flocculosa]|uniref:Eukaryotic translation initiation factor 3 subunit L n=1 Tax=Pseudozyma flocculosa TaxID=84751 RepID=A0A5C3F737_9BASI|nr:related to eIF3l - translation initiation factor 3 subunit L [Pseudozyma flocculosa]
MADFSQQQAQQAAQQQQQRQFFGGEEELGDEEELGEDVDLVVGDYDQGFSGEAAQQGEEGFVDADQVQQAALAQAQQQQQQQAAAALAAVPDQVRKYIVLFNQSIQNNNVQDITNAYEGTWNRLTDKFFSKSEWPEAEVIAPLVNDDQKFLTLYRELWYRHVYSRLSPDGEDRFHSYDNYCDFFNYVLNSEGPVQLELPAQWLWDIVDEFIYQFQSYSQWRNRVSNKTDDEVALLQDGGVWSSYSVLNVLYSLMQKSRITEQLIAAKEGQDPDEVAGEFGSKPLYRMLGYFSIIGLLRVHVLLGDYTLALKMLDHIELNKKSGLINRVTACHVTAYYYVGFAYMMLRRYPDAIKAFTHILVFIMRLRQYHTRSYQYDQINKTADRMYALLAMCCALCPTRLDENIQTAMREKYGDQYAKMTKGGDEGLSAFEELFLYACPKFITGNAPPYHDDEALAVFREVPFPDPAQHQLKVFLGDVKTQLSNSNIRSFLRLYTTLGTDKLASFLEIDEEELVEMMMVVKSSTRSIKWSQGGLLEGEVVNTSDLDFVIDTNMVHIAESRVGRRYGDWFLRNGTRMHDVLTNIQSKALPIVQPKDANADEAAAAAAGGAASQAGKASGASGWATAGRGGRSQRGGRPQPGGGSWGAAARTQPAASTA